MFTLSWHQTNSSLVPTQRERTLVLWWVESSFHAVYTLGSIACLWLMAGGWFTYTCTCRVGFKQYHSNLNLMKIYKCNFTVPKQWVSKNEFLLYQKLCSEMGRIKKISIYCEMKIQLVIISYLQLNVFTFQSKWFAAMVDCFHALYPNRPEFLPQPLTLHCLSTSDPNTA